MRQVVCMQCSKTKDLVWTVYDDNSNPVFQLRPYSNYLCYELFKWGETTRRDTGEVVEEWKAMGVYPTTLEHACSIMRDDMVMKCTGALNDFTQLKRSITQSTNRIIKAIEEAKVMEDDAT